MLDAEIIAALAPAADVRVYFGPNSTAGFLAAINQAFSDGAGVISISWGGPESRWTRQAMRGYEQSFAAIVSGGCSVFAASGDRGSSDGESDGRNHVDFPASAPHVTGCGGTRLTVDASGALAREVVWNDDPTSSATGGGFSSVFRKPAYQKAAVSGAKRGVPDVAGNGDPVTGYPVRVDGHNFVIGGTSAVAPLMSGLTLRLNQITGRPAGDFSTFAYAAADGFSDVTTGNNGAFSAGPGWDPATGLGSPIGGALLTALTSAAAAGALPAPAQVPMSPVAPADGAGRDLLEVLQSVRTAVDALTAAVQELAAGSRPAGATAPAVASGTEPVGALPSPRDTADASVIQPTG
jgi:kumamolisin